MRGTSAQATSSPPPTAPVASRPRRETWSRVSRASSLAVEPFAEPLGYRREWLAFGPITGGGRLSADGIRATAVRATTGGGALRLRCATAPDLVDLDSGGGNVTLRLPTGAYAVDASTEGGNASVRVVQSSTSNHRVDIRSGGGDASVEPV